MPLVSVIVSTYEKPRELELALRSLETSEGLSDLEVLVADDGSEASTRELVETFARASAFLVHHVWHPDAGFRLAAIRNEAIRRCSGEVVVFMDGDSLAKPSTLALHAARCSPGVSHAGERWHLDGAQTRRVLAGQLSCADACTLALPGERRRLRRRYLSNRLQSLLRLKPRPKLLGGNCAVHRQDLERVNGFDERFVGWGLEDDDLARRLRWLGVRITDGVLDCPVAHLHHPLDPSNAPTLKHTTNYKYFHRGGFLACCRKGLVERPLSDVSFQFVGRWPDRLRGLCSELQERDEGKPPEILLVAPGEQFGHVHRDVQQVVEIDQELLRAGDPVRALRDFVESVV